MFAFLISDYQKFLQIIGSPTKFFRALPNTLELKEPLRFAAVVQILLMVVTYLSRIFIQTPFNNWYLPIFFFVGILSIFIFPLFLSIFSNLLKGHGSYQESLRFICYASAINVSSLIFEPLGAWERKLHENGVPHGLLSLMVGVTGIFFLIKFFDIYFSGMREVHGLRTAKALLVLVIPICLFFYSMLMVVHFLRIKGA